MHVRYSLLSLLVATTVLAQEAVQPIRAAPAAPSTFAEVARYLSPDGDYYSYVNSSQLGSGVDQILEFIASLIIAGERNDRRKEKTQRAFEGIRNAIAISGIGGLKGVGVSSVQRSPDLHLHTSVFYHGGDPAEGALWDMVGGEAHPLDGVALMPADTVLGITGDLRLDRTWEFVAAVMEGFGPDGAGALEQMRESFRRQGHDIDAMMASFSGTVTVAVTMDPERTRPADPHKQHIQIPEIGAFLALSVDSDLVFDAFAKELADEQRLERHEDAEVTILSVREKVPLPLRMWPTVARSDGLLFLATNPDIVRAALAARADGSGLRESTEFQSLTTGLPAEGNHLAFIGGRLTEEAKRILGAVIRDEAGGGGDGRNPQVWQGRAHQLGELRVEGVQVVPAEVVVEVLEDGGAEPAPAAAAVARIDAVPPFQACTVSRHYDDAMVLYSHSSVSLANVMMLQSLAPAMMAGIVLPAVQRAQHQAIRAAHQARVAQVAHDRRPPEAAGPVIDGGAHTMGGTMVTVKTLIQELDQNGNLTLEETELQDGLLGMLDQHDAARQILLPAFDKDGDGEFNGAEVQEVRRFAFGLVGVVPFDPNGDWKLDDPEVDGAWDRLAEACQTHNDDLLRRYDRDGDGELNKQEAAAARQGRGRR